MGVLSVGVDTGVLVALRGGLGAPLWLATTLSFLASLVVNFGLNSTLVFAARDRLRTRLARYAVMVAVNYTLTLLIVLGLAAAGMPYVLAKWTAIALCAGVNFAGYRRWVFAAA